MCERLEKAVFFEVEKHFNADYACYANVIIVSQSIGTLSASIKMETHKPPRKKVVVRQPWRPI